MAAHLTSEVLVSLSENLRRLEIDGFCVLKEVIPSRELEEIRNTLVSAQEAQHEEAEGTLQEIRKKGHRVGAEGVALLKQAINHTQCFAPYVASGKILDVVEARFGAYVRVSCTDCVVNHPGNERGYWHADWPFNQTNGSHIPAPYPDTTVHLSSIWMLTPFGPETGGTFLIPGSHRNTDNPSAGKLKDIDPDAPYPAEIQATGDAGSVLLYDSRLWHAVAPNLSQLPRVALIIRYAPWWLNLNPTMAGTPEHTQMVVETNGKNYESLPVTHEAYSKLPENVKPLYRHWMK